MRNNKRWFTANVSGACADSDGEGATRPPAKVRPPPMLNLSEITLKRPLPAREGRSADSVVQDRPTLGAMPGSRQGLSWWVVPLIDFLSSVLALAVVTRTAGAGLFP